jgi:hypothetical protein
MKAQPEAASCRLEEAALLLEKMAKQLRALKTDRSKARSDFKMPAEVPSAADVPSAAGPATVQVGSRVRVVRKDRYRGRTGVVVRRHGKLFWDVQLDATETSSRCLIYKKDASLCVVGSD